VEATKPKVRLKTSKPALYRYISRAVYPTLLIAKSKKDSALRWNPRNKVEKHSQTPRR